MGPNYFSVFLVLCAVHAVVRSICNFFFWFPVASLFLQTSFVLSSFARSPVVVVTSPPPRVICIFCVGYYRWWGFHTLFLLMAVLLLFALCIHFENPREVSGRARTRGEQQQQQQPAKNTARMLFALTRPMRTWRWGGWEKAEIGQM